MQHPFFHNQRSIIIYALAWIVLAAIQVSILYFFYHVNILSACLQSVISYTIYLAIGLGLWYPVQFTYQMSASQGTRLLNLVGLGTVTILVWYTLSSAIMQLVLKNDQPFLDFIRKSLPLNISIGILLFLILVLVYYLILYFASLEERKVAEARLQTLVRESELNVLKYKLNPHFLFNSLNSISALTLSRPENAQEMVIKLSDYLRYSLEAEQSPMKNLKEELEHIQLYLDIEKVRFGNRLQVETSISESCLEQKVPGMILQPLVENAIKHGVHESTEPVTVHLKCAVAGGMMRISVSNEYTPTQSNTSGTGTGLSSVRKRLAGIYDRPDLVEINRTGNLFEVVLKIPVGPPTEA